MINTHEALINYAREAVQMAYAPYSMFTVGAAVQASSGKIYTGSNVENASYGLSICAERVAVFKAIQEGERRLVALALEAKDNGSTPQTTLVPCGACLQVLSEFMPIDSPVFISGSLAGVFRDFFPQPFILIRREDKPSLT